MKIDISKTLASDGAAEPYDVLQVKIALNRLGYYVPYEKVGITGIPDQRMFDAIKSFQRMNNLQVSGQIRPEDETAKAINVALLEPQDGYYIWRSVEDGKVRAAHAQYNRTVRAWSESPDPGEDFGCRCWAEPLKERHFLLPRALNLNLQNPAVFINDPPLESVYPELLLPPLMGVGRLYVAWRLWQTAKNTAWTLGKYKSPTRWGNQMKNRDWTPEQITKTIEKGRKWPAPNKVNKGNKATRYEYEERFVVKDNVTNEILQISGPKFEANKMP